MTPFSMWNLFLAAVIPKAPLKALYIWLRAADQRDFKHSAVPIIRETIGENDVFCELKFAEGLLSVDICSEEGNLW